MKRMLASLALIGCTPPYAEMLASTSSSDESTSTTTTTTSGDTTTTESTTTDDDYVTTFSIMQPPDLGPYAPECDVFSQDCPPGEKCMPYASDGVVIDGTRCSPIADDPRALGEPCTAVLPGFTGLDDCAHGLMCWFLDARGAGECLELCSGSEWNPLCTDPCSSCMFNATGDLALCFPTCDPLAQDCGEGWGCYPIVDSFACAPDVSGFAGVVGDPCELINVCDPGLLCVNPELVPGCEGASCCTPFCNMDTPDDCDAQLPGTVCRAWFEVGEFGNTCVPTGTVGFCAVPA